MRDDELLRRYLLGALPEAEAVELEPRLLAEENLFDLAEAIESEILEDYARGELSPADRDHVARYLASSPSAPLRLAVVRGLAALSADLARPTAGQVLPFSRPPAAVLRPRDLAAALAAMLVLALAAVIGARITIEPPRMVEQPPATSIGHPAGDHGAQPPARPTPPDQIAEDRRPAPPVTAPTPSPAIFTAATMILSSVRGEEEIPSVDVPAGTDLVEMPLRLPSGDERYPSYQIVLEDQTGEKVLSLANLHAEKSLLVVPVDAERLRTGRYTLEVSGIDHEGAATPIDFKEFEVRKP